MLGNYIVSIIRTVVPVGVGYLVVWAAGLGVELDDGVLVPAAVGIITAGYYAIVRFLESKWPAFGWLLGVAKAPDYDLAA